MFSGAIARADCSDGDIVEVFASDGSWLARGYYNGRSQISLRLLTWERGEAVDEAFWRRRIERALLSRALQPDHCSSALRLINAESDAIPGLVADLYVGQDAERMSGPRTAALLVQALSLGIDQRLDGLVRLLQEMVIPDRLPQLGGWQQLAIYERSDVDVRHLEGLPERAGPVFGDVPDRLVIEECGLRFEVDVKHGHKTGHYLDQRLNRARVASYCRGAQVLNAFSYTGGFSIHALAAGANSATDVDSSAAALAAAKRNLALNRLDESRHVLIEGDVFQVLRTLRDEGRIFDVVVLDPPKFAHSAGQVQAACRGYKDVNMLGMSVLRPGGVLATFSCSGLVPAELFQKVIFGAGLDAGRDVQVLEPLSQAPDHPVLLAFPESAYLKGFICRVW